MNLDKFKGKRMVHEDDKKYLEDLVYYHPDPSALWSGDNVEAGYGIDITLTPATTISVDTDVVLTRPNLTDYSINDVIIADSEIQSGSVDLRAVTSQEVNSFLSLEPTSAILKTVSGTDNSTIGVSGTEIDVTTGMFKYNSSEVATKADLVDKQDKLTAGDNITIDSDNIISAVDTTYTAGNNITIDSDNVISATVKTYTAGANITIDANDVISATDTTYTAGTNVTIDANNVISATNTTYTGVDYVDVNSTDNEIGLDATGKAAIDLVDGHMTESQGSITISDVNQINGTNYVLDADGYLVNEANGDIKFGTQNANGSVYSDLYLIAGGEGWYLETNNANVSTSVAMDTTVMTQDTAYEFKQDGIYLNNNKITNPTTYEERVYQLRYVAADLSTLAAYDAYVINVVFSYICKSTDAELTKQTAWQYLEDSGIASNAIPNARLSVMVYNRTTGTVAPSLYCIQQLFDDTNSIKATFPELDVTTGISTGQYATANPITSSEWVLTKLSTRTI